MHIQTLEDTKPQEDENQNGFSSYDPPMLIKRADEAFVKGDFKEAFFLLDEANVKDPKNSEILSKLGYIAAKEARVNEAISYYEEALHGENSDIFHNAIASLYREIQEYNKAQAHYEEALKIDANYAVTYFNYANLLVDMKRLSEAKAMYEKAYHVDPDLTQAKEEIEKIRDKI